MRQASTILPIRASRPGLHELTQDVRTWVAESAIVDGLLTLFCRHTSASLIIQENAAPAARRDLEAYFARLAPETARTNMTTRGRTTCRPICGVP
jgi:secondary thiamine-phosphate synthase enzyme